MPQSCPSLGTRKPGSLSAITDEGHSPPLAAWQDRRHLCAPAECPGVDETDTYNRTLSPNCGGQEGGEKREMVTGRGLGVERGEGQGGRAAGQVLPQTGARGPQAPPRPLSFQSLQPAPGPPWSPGYHGSSRPGYGSHLASGTLTPGPCPLSAGAPLGQHWLFLPGLLWPSYLEEAATTCFGVLT